MRINPGSEHSISERWYDEIRRGRAFGGSTDIGPLAANFSEVQLFNPAASGVTAIVACAIATVGTLGITQLRTHNAALATDVMAGINLRSGAPPGQCHVRSTNVAAADGTIVLQVSLLANTPYPFHHNWIAELGEDEGVLVTTGAVNVRVIVSYLWIEL